MPGSLRIRSKPLEGMAPPPAGTPNADSYLSKLAKMIPGEAQSLYIIGGSLIKGDGTRPYLLAWQLGVCGLVVLVVRWIGTADDRIKNPDFMHIFWSLVAFYVWVYAASETFKNWPSPAVYSFLPTLLVLLATFAIPYFYSGRSVGA